MRIRYFFSMLLFYTCIDAKSQETQYEQFELPAPIIVNVSEIADQMIRPEREFEISIESEQEQEENELYNIPGPVNELEVISGNNDDTYFNEDFYIPEYPDFSNPERTVSPAACQSYIGMEESTPCPPVTNHWATDYAGAVGPNHIMEVSGTNYQIKTKTGITLSTISDIAFFGGDANYSHFDPRITYDIYNNRWIVITAGYNYYSSPGIGNIAIAVSQTSDPTGSWYIYNISTQTETVCTINGDYPYLGLNKKWIVISVWPVTPSWSLTPCSPPYSAQTRFYVLSKSTLFSGAVGTVTQIDDASNSHVVPAITYDNTLNDLYLVNSASPNLKLYKISGPVSTPVYSFVTNIAAPGGLSWSSLSDLPQPSGVGINDWTGSRVQNAVYRNGKLWVTHSVKPSGTSRGAVQWWQIDPVTYTVAQFGRIEDLSNTYSYAFPSIAVNANNDVLIGYSRFSSSYYASAGYSFRLNTDPVNTMQDPYIYKAGEDNFGTAASTGITYGDYSGTYIDPVDNSFWTIQEYAKTRGIHGKFSGCQGASVAANAGSWWAHVNTTAPPMPTTIIREDIDECCVYNLKVATSPLANSYEWKIGGGAWQSSPNTGAYNYYPLGWIEGEGPYNVQVRAYNLCGYSSIKSSSITCDMPGDCPLRQGSETTERMNDVSIFPNPANGYFTVSFNYLDNGSMLYLYNVSGDLLHAGEIDKNNKIFDLTGYAKGIYLVSITSESVSKKFKLIIE